MKIARMYPDIRYGGLYAGISELDQRLVEMGHEVTFPGKGYGRFMFWFKCKPGNCDIIHLHDFNLPSLTSNIPTVSTYHGCMWDITKKTLSMRAFAGAVMQSVRVRMSDVNVAISEFVQKEIKDSILIPNGTDTKMFNPNVKPFDIKTDKIKVLWVGRKEWLKGYYDLPKTVKEFYLIECYDKPHKDMPRYYASCDVFILPSHSEGLPRSVLEAMACGKPIVAYDVAALPEIVIDGFNGYLVKENDYQDFIAKIKLAYKNRKKLGRNGRKLCESKHSLDVVVSKYEEVYKRLLGS